MTFPRSLADKEEIRDLIYAYCRGVDRSDPVQIQAVFHADAILDYGGFVGTPADFAKMACTNLARLKSTHHDMTNILITLDGDRACGETYGMALHCAQPQPDGRLVDFTAYVRYLDVFERREGCWKIASRTVVQDAKIVVPHNATEISTNLSRPPPQGRRDGDDLSYRLPKEIGTPDASRVKTS